ncbi:thiosulfate:glutathione sulfurtransferase [Brienomyrus brachyistius]|uniref:thiosulfate:glutathione sulfurtransferase n=1 Tax=Brienomyrus brachyistius TaxID=42636 RepID=UPI0020B3E660|nr:thiosulfate:glutathione sulfurtransferase [Brienomyrus brachyistius]XP_048868085.1 thiosulfate:glutathione sulfurtransferase [Brienomyrus brachyistius]
MRSGPLAAMVAVLLLMRRIVLTTADAAAGTGAFCGQCAAGKCGVKTSPVVLQESRAPEPVVSYEQLKTMLSSHSIQLFDVRNPDEFQAGWIPDATNIPLGELEEALQLTPDLFRSRFHVVAPKKTDSNIVFYCRKGNRSATALEIAFRLGFSRAQHYAGGYKEWEQYERQ